ncbi:MAG: hypothetical protein KF770_32905, partial [Anaerolineae bacterium]|nr:hypothetical protein [Anaerolineae bacterium]
MRKPLSLLSLTVALLLISWFSIEPDVKSSSASTGQTRGFTNVSGAQQDDPVKIVVSDPVVPTISLPISQLPLYEPEYYLDREINPRLSDLDNFDPNLRGVGGLDPLLAVQASVTPQGGDFLTPILNFAGQGFTGVNPPDTEGDVGPNHYIQMINAGGGAVLTIYDKNGVLLAGPTSLDSLGTGSCASGLGDPIVLYDQLADRWLLSEFAASGNHLCVYISATNDPVTTNWFAYDFTTPNFPDYPKYAVWPDAYYVSSNESSPAAYALDRTNMLAGQPATSQRFTAPDLSGFPFQALTPSDHDGATPPPAGSPNYFMRHRDTEVHGAGACTNPATTDCLEIWAFHVDFDTPANSTFALAQTIEVTNFDSDLCGLVSFSCFPMPGTGTTLDPLREVIMWRLQYRNFGAYETLVGNLVTDVDGTNHGGVRWFELRKSGASPWALYQEGTLAPDIHHRWMGSSAMDGSGNIALGYSVSSSTVFPSIRYAGRLASDPLGTLPYVEGTIVNGSASNASNRWGDYSAMSVDPADDCTFWYTHMYNVSSTWSTRIATMRFPQCGGPGFSISATPESQSICMPADAIYNVNLSFTDGYDAPVDLSANGVPAGATAVFDPSTVISPTTSSVFTISNTGSASPGSYSIDIIGMGTPTP